MLKKTLLFILLCCFFFPQEGRADKIKINGDQFQRGLIALVPSYFAHIALHEGSHALAIKSMGGTIVDFRVWPSVIDDKLYFGYVRWISDQPFTKQQRAFTILAPQITNALLFCATETIFYCNQISPRSPAAPFLFVFGELIPWIDFLATIIKSSDIEHLESQAGVPHYVSGSVGAVFAAVGAYFLAKRAYAIFFQRRSRPHKYKRPCNLSVDSGAGILLTIRF